MKLSTAKKFVSGFKKSVKDRGGVLCREKLKNSLHQMQDALDSNGINDKY